MSTYKTKTFKTILLLATISLSGCVNTQFEKSISITKDAQGNIISTTETERVVQPNQQGWPVKLQYLKGIQSQN